MSAPVARHGFTEESVTELIQRREEPDWMRERRLDAWKTYQVIPMPTRQDEEWRRTDLRALHLNDVSPYGEARPVQGTLVPEAERDEEYAGFLGFSDGQVVEYRFDEALAARGVIFTDLVTAVREHGDLVQRYFMTECVPPTDSKFAALHGAFWDNGTFLYVPRGVMIELPLRVVASATLNGTSSLTHTLVVMEEASSAILVEDATSPTGDQQGFSDRVTEIIQHEGSALRYTGIQALGRKVFDFYTDRAMLGKDATLNLQTIELGSHLSKGRVETVLRGAGVNTKLLGLYIEDGDQHFDRYTLQDHIASDGMSDLLFKGVLTDTARSVFSGLIRVSPAGKKTAAYQQNRNLLLSRKARADSIPNLEIGANDIIGCSHGATIGKVDEEQLFYLMCRGLNRADATRLIVEGFVEPVLDQVPVASVREALRRTIQDRVRGTDL
jgi:Fe-S cluster assembly protein SufD